MADIDVVPRRRTNIWLWIIVALIVIGVLWWALAGGHGSNATSSLMTTPHVLARVATTALALAS